MSGRVEYVVNLESPTHVETVTCTSTPVECYRNGVLLRRRVYTLTRFGRVVCRFACTRHSAAKVEARRGRIHITERMIVRLPGE